MELRKNQRIRTSKDGAVHRPVVARVRFLGLAGLPNREPGPNPFDIRVQVGFDSSAFLGWFSLSLFLHYLGLILKSLVST